ncbi:hypothetical protein ABB37_03189 [Leptomonas pyrrhocoris]|uniref:Uncharacterized protein n=1 Tax=Leptomonas pyrrhocoris TaxID=157538 RepID=A0A0M9G4D2_LEPPY|nr:hypothetical protein ABB37_03189 [Leptomonas pyrrhocoris]KPA82013.1 hypothetical protein ABB37_03189 [Leptomonas pyrrhocoris]|eukprot:XP_015660452.1 hypothetical protein ABB37_03189 [Leptomonas pyrrhocoris]
MMPATSAWCQGPVPTKWGSQESAACPRVQLRAYWLGGQVWVVHMRKRLAAGHMFDTAHKNAYLRVTQTLRWTAEVIFLLRRGDVERNPDSPQGLCSLTEGTISWGVIVISFVLGRK